MRWMMVVAGVLAAGAAHAGFADGVPVSVAEKECHFQAAIIDQTYSLYRSGASAEQAVARQTAPETPAASRRWVKKIVDSIYSDTRSMFVNQGATVFAYEQKCLADPERYIRNKDLLK